MGDSVARFVAYGWRLYRFEAVTLISGLEKMVAVAGARGAEWSAAVEGDESRLRREHPEDALIRRLRSADSGWRLLLALLPVDLLSGPSRNGWLLIRL